MRTRLSLRGAALGVTLAISASSAVLVAAASPAGAAPVAVPKPAMRITEFSYQLRDFGEAEFVELTNVGTTPVNLGGWSFDDVDGVPGAFDLSSLGTAAPGESVIITDVSAEAFRAYFGLAPTVKVVGGSTQGLGNGDQINVWDDARNLVDRLTYDDTPRSRDNSVVPSSLAAVGANQYDSWVLSTTANDPGSITVDAVAGGSTSIASPGTSSFSAGPVDAPALPIRITEFSYQLRDFGQAEFFELTNVGSTPVNLDGWSFDDASPVVGTFPLSGLGVVAPGESAVVTDTTPEAFRTYFGLCSAVKVLGGSTQGLGNGDEINVFDDAGNVADKITYTSSPRSQDVSVVPTSAAALAANDYAQWALSNPTNDPGSKTVDAVAGGETSIASPGTSRYATVAFDPCPAPPDPTDPGIDLSTYGLVGRYALPSHLDTPSLAPAGSELATEVSAITYDWDTDTLFVVGDEGTSLVQVSKTGQLIDSMTLTGFEDTEGVTYVGNGTFVIGEERVRQAVLVTYTAGTTFARSSGQVVKLGSTVGNIGLEGIGYDPLGDTAGGLGFIGVKESGPLGLFETTIDFAAGTATNGGPSTEPTNLFDPALVGTSDLSDVFPLSQVPTIDGGENPNLLVISQESGRIVNMTRDGAVANQLDIVDAGAPLSVPAQTMEGVALDHTKVMYTTAEGGGGDASHPQLLVWAPGASPLSRLAVTEVAPWGSDAPYTADWFELTNTGATTLDLTGVKVDDSSNAFATAADLTGVSSLAPGESAVFFEKPAAGDAATIAAAFGQTWFGAAGLPAGFKIGSYTGTGIGLSGSSGDAVNVFAPDGSHVTGVSFGSATANVTFDNTARLGAAAAPVAIGSLASEGVFGAFRAADGVAVGSPGDVTPSGPVDPGGDFSAVEITEVAAFGSGSSPYAADWIEVTNNGTESVNLTGWKVDDSSALFSSALDLVGVPVLPPGRSAIFYEGTDDAAFQLAFAQAWFGQNLFDAGFLFGHYTGGGAGLSTGGDAVVLFASDGAVVSGVAFGPSPATAPFATFDNTEGLGTETAPFPVLTTLSSVGTNGAFTAVDDHAIGSPGTATANQAPTALEQTVSANAPTSDTLLTLTGSDPDGDALTYSVAAPPGKGTVSCVPGGSCTYVAAPGRTGTDSFTFTAFDGDQVSAPATVTLLLDDTTPGLFIGDSRMMEPESPNTSSRSALVPLTLSRPSASPVVVRYFTVSGSAMAKTDFTVFGTPAAPRAITIPAGAVRTSINVPVREDALIEGDESFTVHVVSATGGVYVGDDDGTVTIEDTDTASTGEPALVIVGTRQYEGNVGARSIQFRVELTKAAATPIVASYAITGGTCAVPSGIVRGVARTLVFAPGALAKSIDVGVTQDTVAEPDCTIEITITAPGTPVRTATATATVVDDD